MVRQTQAAEPAALQVGTDVIVQLLAGRVRGKIVEDRGPLGVGGRRLWRVLVPNDPFAAREMLLGEDEIQPAADDEPEVLDSDAIVDYLVHGGLVQILRSNQAGAPHASRVWLRHDPHGRVVHTFLEDFGVVGGAVAPSGCLHGERVFSPRVQAVVEFLSGFGLTDAQCESVVEGVGRAP